MTNTSFDTLLTCLRGGQPPRIWSLLVTVFGELAQDESAEISGAVLNHLSGLIGLKPEATRVALHRLRKDGWIDNHRIGRSTSYSLTEWGRVQSAAASPLIYANAPPADEAWMIVNDPTDTRSSEGAAVAPNIVIAGSKPENTAIYAVKLNPDMALPDWMTRKICPPPLIQASIDLSKQLSDLETLLDSARPLTAAQSAALRVMIVHSWRRIRLKAPALPDQVFPETWMGAKCRQHVYDVLLKLPKPTLIALQEAVLPAPT